jgi:enamine deaminase RidA (YjgF/YER057c/UK114 family)
MKKYWAHSGQRQVLRNLSAVLEAAGSSLKNVVKVNVFLTDMSNFAAMNEVYDEFFVWQPKPVRVASRLLRIEPANGKPFTQCRTCVAVHQLPFNTDVEIECTAFETVKARL